MAEHEVVELETIEIDDLRRKLIQLIRFGNEQSIKSWYLYLSAQERESVNDPWIIDPDAGIAIPISGLDTLEAAIQKALQVLSEKVASRKQSDAMQIQNLKDRQIARDLGLNIDLEDDD